MTFKQSYSYQVPFFKKNEFQKRMHKYCVCVFVINEGERLQNQLKKMKSLAKIIDIVIADGGSTDNSTEHEFLQKMNVNTLLVKEDNGHLGSQMRMAFFWALERGYEGIIVIDGNGKDDIQGIPSFMEKLDDGHDHIQGSRFIPGGHHENTPLYRLIALKLLHVPIIRWASGFSYTDTTNGFRAYSARLLCSSSLRIFRSVFTGYELHYYLAIQSVKQGFKCTEIPVKRRYPKSGKTPTKISFIRGNFSLLYKLILVALGKYGVTIR